MNIRIIGSLLALLAVVGLTAITAAPALAWTCQGGVPDTQANRDKGLCVLHPQPTTKPTPKPTEAPQAPKPRPTELPAVKPSPKPVETPPVPKPRPTEVPEQHKPLEAPKPRPTQTPVSQPAGCVPEDEPQAKGDNTPPGKEGNPADDVPCTQGPPVTVPIEHRPPPTSTPPPVQTPPTQQPPKEVTCAKGEEHPAGDNARCVPTVTQIQQPPADLPCSMTAVPGKSRVCHTQPTQTSQSAPQERTNQPAGSYPVAAKQPLTVSASAPARLQQLPSPPQAGQAQPAGALAETGSSGANLALLGGLLIVLLGLLTLKVLDKVEVEEEAKQR